MTSKQKTLYAEEFPLEKEYEKNTGISPQDVSRLRDWLRNQPHLPENLITDMDLILAYHCCERSSEVAKQVLDLNLTLKTLFTRLFKDRSLDENIKKLLQTMLIKPLPTRSDEGYACIYIRFLDVNPKNFVYVHAVKAFLMILDLWQYEQGTWPGLVILIDLEGFTLAHVAALDLQTLQHFFYFLQEALLVKLKSFHFLNAPSFMDKVMQLIKPFLKAELLSVLHTHTAGSQSLDNFYPTSALLEVVEGKHESLAACRDEVIEKLEANKEFFEKENMKRVVESLRPGKPKTVSDIFGGVEGSFKKLSID